MTFKDDPLFVYDIRTSQWRLEYGKGTTLKTLLQCPGMAGISVDNAKSVLLNSSMLFWGGRCGHDLRHYEQRMFEFNLEKKRWSVCNPTGRVPKGRMGHTMDLVGSRLFVIGGACSSGQSDQEVEQVGSMSIFDTCRSKW